MSEAQHVTVDMRALLGNYLGEIQNLLDIITFVYAGHKSVREDQYQTALSFMSFHPAANRKLSYDHAKERSGQWLLTSFLTDSINATGNFLDECHKICALYRLGGAGSLVGQEAKDVFEKDVKAFPRRSFPGKFQRLRDDFGVETDLEEHFMSLNKARNCLVHRRGIVSPGDTNRENELVIKWRAVQLVVRPPDGAEGTAIEAPTVVDEGSSIGLKFQEKARAFKMRQRITLEAAELCQSIYTLSLFASKLVESIEAYGDAQGVLDLAESQPDAPADAEKPRR